MTEDRKLGRGTAWIAVASALSGVLDVITTVTCLWLWLSPDDLGLATLAGALLPVIERLAGVGMPAAMVREGGDDPRALATLWWVMLAASIAVLAAAVALAGPIGGALGAPVIGSLVCGYAVRQLLSTAHAVPEAVLRRNLAFDALTRVRIAAAFTDAAGKLITAYLGAHLWPALRAWPFVIGPLVGGIATSIGLQLAWPWRPRLAFDAAVARRGLAYGVPLSAGELLYFVYSNADYLVIGRAWGAAAVGAYRLAYELVLDVVRLISLVTAEVAFPAFARLRDPEAAGPRGAAARAGELLLRFTRQNLLAVAPVVVVLAVCADDLLALLYPPLPAAAVRAAQILCVVGALRMMSFVLPAVLAGLGHAGDALAYHAVAAALLPAAFAAAAGLWPAAGFVAVAWAWAAGYPAVFAVVLWRALVRCQVGLGSYLRRTLGVIAAGGVAAVGAGAVHAALPPPHLVRLVAVAAATVAGYALALTWIEGLTPRRLWRMVRGHDA